MKRRTFLTATSTIGIASVASSATVVSTVYNDVSTNLLLEDFDASSKKVLNKFVADITENTKSLGLDEKIAKRLAMPVQIISNETSGNAQNIKYKNKYGQIITITTKNGKRVLRVLETA